MKDQHSRDLQVESMTQCAFRTTGIWNKYWETYAPLDTWHTLRVFVILSLIHGWASHQLNFVMVYPQTPAEKPLYMRLLQGYHHKGITKDTHALNLIRNIYGQKPAGRVWTNIRMKA